MSINVYGCFNPVKIGIDASSVIAQKTGIGSFASQLLDQFDRSPQEIDFVRLGPHLKKDMNTPQRLYWETFLLPSLAHKVHVDVLYSPGFSPPPAGKFRRIVTVHDLIGLLFPQNVGFASRFYWSHWLPGNLKKAQRLVASSECTKRDIVRFLKLSPERIEVVPLAVRSSFCVLQETTKIRGAAERHQIRGPYLISVSSLEPRKNYLRLLKAFERLYRNRRDLSLVIIGKPAGAEAELKKFITEKKLTESVKLLGYVPEEDMISLYNGALGYVMISLYEGFGLPVLEAMNCGLAGVIADNSSLPEVAGDAAIHVPPQDETAIYVALRKLLEDQTAQKKMSEIALKRSQQFSIQKTASRLIEIFKKECQF